MKIANLVLNDFTSDHRVLKVSQSLRDHGHDVTIVALHREGLAENEFVDNIRVRRLKLKSKNLKISLLGKIVKLFEFWVKARLFLYQFDAVHCNDLNALFIGAIGKYPQKQLLIFDSHELAINETPWEGPLSIKAKFCTERFLLRRTCVVICVCDSIAKIYARLYKIKRPIVVKNCPHYSDLDSDGILARSLGISPRQKICLFQGRLSPGRGLKTLGEFFSSRVLNDKVLIVLGDGPLSGYFKGLAERSANIFYVEKVSLELLASYTASADVGFSLFNGSACRSYKYCLPNKVFEYVMAGIPVITTDLPEMKKVVRQYSIGTAVDMDKTNADDFFSEIDRLIALSSTPQFHSCVQIAKQELSWQQQEKKLILAYGQLNA